MKPVTPPVKPKQGILKLKIIHKDELDELETEINKYLKEGWQLEGEMRYIDEYIQEMVKYEYK